MPDSPPDAASLGDASLRTMASAAKKPSFGVHLTANHDPKRSNLNRLDGGWGGSPDAQRCQRASCVECRAFWRCTTPRHCKKMYNPAVMSIPTLSLIVAAIAVFFGPWISLRIAKRQMASSAEVANKQITAPMRQAWINNLRDLIAELAGDALHYFPAGHDFK